MADITLTKRNYDFYHCVEDSGSTLITNLDEGVMTRYNAVDTSSWVRSKAFTTGDYNVTNITITVSDTSLRWNTFGNPSVGIGTTIDDFPGHTDTPDVLWSASDTTNEIVNGYNQYKMTFDVDMKARTNYYLYLYTWCSAESEAAWDCLANPNSSQPNRTTTIEITFNEKEEDPPLYNLTINPNEGTMRKGSEGWVSDPFTIKFAYGNRTYIGKLNNDQTYWTTNEPKGPAGYNKFRTFSISPGGTWEQNISGENFVFEGGALGVNGYGNNTNTYVFNGDYAGDVTITAHYSPNTYYIQYNANGGSGTMAKSDHIYDTAKALAVCSFTRTGYEFKGWDTNSAGTTVVYTDQASVINLSTTNGATINLYAVWEPENVIVKYTLTYHPNGGSGNIPDSTTLTGGIEITLAGAIFSKTRHILSEWNTKPDGSGTSYSLNSKVANLTSTNGDEVILYAIWKQSSSMFIWTGSQWYKVY